MSAITDEIEAFEAMRSALEAQHKGKWAVVHSRKLEGVFDTFEDAAQEAVARFGKGPYLIRQIGVDRPTLPVSVMFHRVHAQG